MEAFAGQVAIVTGGASGIGRAVGAELVQQGARVVLADVNGDGAAAAAAAMSANGAATGVALDVRGAAAVERLVQDTAAALGRLDYVFNNAGIAIMGNARNMTLDDWTRLVDINLRGVIHGVAAAYPLMLRQGHGHIVNTASLAGLIPSPGATGYAMTKHAVVGLSLSLRAEAANAGVRVSVVCPGFIDTPIKDSTQLLNTDRVTALQSLPFRLYSVESCARQIVRGVARNRAIIIVTPHAKIAWRLNRLAPLLMLRLAQAVARRSPLLALRT